MKKRLKFVVLDSKLSRKEAGIILSDLADHLKWVKSLELSNIIEFNTPENLLSPLTREQITILFGKDKIYINSVRNLDAVRKYFGKINRNAFNVKIITEEINKANRKLKGKNLN